MRISKCFKNGILCEYALVNGDCISEDGCHKFDIAEIVKETSRWHTGRPTEEGWYLVQHLSDAEYCGSKFFVARWDGEKFVINPRPPIVVTYPKGTAWQKIEPYEASN